MHESGETVKRYLYSEFISQLFVDIGPEPDHVNTSLPLTLPTCITLVPSQTTNKWSQTTFEDQKLRSKGRLQACPFPCGRNSPFLYPNILFHLVH